MSSEVAERVDEAQRAWEMYVEGASKREIARTLDRARGTVDRLLSEAVAWRGSDSNEVKRAAMVEAQKRIIRHAWEQLNARDEDGNAAIKPTSLTGPQWAMQIREAQKEIARLEGLHVEQKNVRHEHWNLAELAREAARQEQDNVVDMEPVPDDE